jgi:DNA-directed RNA polymerase subunit M/transcription elongation factor TFIIS
MAKRCPNCGGELKTRNQTSGKFIFTMSYCPQCGWHKSTKRRVESPNYSSEDIRRAVGKVKKAVETKLKNMKTKEEEGIGFD